MFPKKPTPGESTLKSRSIVASKSLALTGVPSEYLRPFRSVIVYVLPPFVTFGSVLCEVRHDRRARRGRSRACSR